MSEFVAAVIPQGLIPSGLGGGRPVQLEPDDDGYPEPIEEEDQPPVLADNLPDLPAADAVPQEATAMAEPDSADGLTQAEVAPVQPGDTDGPAGNEAGLPAQGAQRWEGPAGDVGLDQTGDQAGARADDGFVLPEETRRDPAPSKGAAETARQRPADDASGARARDDTPRLGPVQDHPSGETGDEIDPVDAAARFVLRSQADRRAPDRPSDVESLSTRPGAGDETASRSEGHRPNGPVRLKAGSSIQAWADPLATFVLVSRLGPILRTNSDHSLAEPGRRKARRWRRLRGFRNKA